MADRYQLPGHLTEFCLNTNYNLTKGRVAFFTSLQAAEPV